MLDPELIVIEYLRSIGIDAYADVPSQRPREFVTVERTGGGFGNYIVDNPTIAVQVWSETRYKASQLAYTVRSAITDMVTIQGVNRVVINSGPYNFPDLEGRIPRYQLIIELTLTN